MKSKAKTIIPISTIVALCATAATHAATLVSSADTYIYSSNGDTNYGAGENMVSNWSGTTYRMAVFSFNVPDEMIGNITSANLQLQDVIGNATKAYNIYGLLDAHESFNETTLTWNNAGFLSGSTIDLTKVYGGAELGVFNNTQNSVNTVFDVTSGNYLDFLNASTNSTVTFVIVDMGSGNTGSGWATKEHTTALKPTLTLIPEPTSALLGGIGMLFLLKRRRVNESRSVGISPMS